MPQSNSATKSLLEILIMCPLCCPPDFLRISQHEQPLIFFFELTQQNKIVRRQKYLPFRGNKDNYLASIRMFSDLTENGFVHVSHPGDIVFLAKPFKPKLIEFFMLAEWVVEVYEVFFGAPEPVGHV